MRAVDGIDLTVADGSVTALVGESGSGKTTVARAVLARSLLLSPRLLILDEPTASLDTQVKATVLDLLAELRDDLSLTLLVITHELPTARAIADEVAVMRDGLIVEHGPTEQVFTAPDHPYTQALLASIPADPRTPPT